MQVLIRQETMSEVDLNHKYVSSVWIKWLTDMKISKYLTVDAMGVQVFTKNIYLLDDRLNVIETY